MVLMIDGVRKIASGEWSLYYIDQLSDALKWKYETVYHQYAME